MPSNSLELRSPRPTWIWWLLVSLMVLVFLPGMMSGHYLPKTLWAAVTVGLGLALVRPRNPGRMEITPLGVIWLAYLAWALLSSLWAPSPRVSLDRWLTLLVPTSAYLLARRSRFWESNAFWFGFGILTGLVALVGISQYFFPHLPFIRSIPGTSIPRATMGHRNYAGMYFMLTLPFLLWCYLRFSRGKKLFFALNLILVLLFILVTRNRGAWLGILVGMLFIVVACVRRLWLGHKAKQGNILCRRGRGGDYSPPRDGSISDPDIDRSGRKRLFQLTGLIVAFALAVLVFILFETYGRHRRFAPKKGDLLRTAAILLSGQERFDMWNMCWGVASPVYGSGLGNFPILLTPTIKSGEVVALNYEIHNDYLQAYLDLGVPGLMLFSLFFGMLLYIAWKRRDQGLFLAAGAAIAGIAAMQFTTFTAQKVSSQIWLAGIIAILNFREKPRIILPKPLPRRLGLITNYCLSVLLVIYAVLVGFTIRGDYTFRQSLPTLRRILSAQEALRETVNESPPEFARRQMAFDLQIRALELLQWLQIRVLPAMYVDLNIQHLYCVQYGNIAQRLKNYPAAEAFARRALEIHPVDHISLKRLYEIAREDGREDRAEYLLNKGIAVFGYNPYNLFLASILAAADEMAKPEVSIAQVANLLSMNRLAKPENPYPCNRMDEVPVEVVFRWDGCRAADSYDLYIWRQGEQIPESPQAARLSKSKASLNFNLEYDTIYFWQIKAIGKYAEQPGNLWFFRTKGRGEQHFSVSEDQYRYLGSEGEGLPREIAAREDEYREKVAKADNFLEWFRLRETYREAGGEEPGFLEALAEKEKELRRNNPPRAFNEYIELADFGWKLEAGDPGEGKVAQFKISWLFFKKRQIEDDGQKMRILLACFTADAHRKYLRQSRNRINLGVTMESAVSQWPIGNYKLVTYRCKLPSLPLHMITWISWDGKSGPKRGRFGERIQLGWQADLEN